MSIKDQVRELNILSTEIKRLRDEIKHLSDRKKQVEESICSYLKMNNDPGLKYKDTAILLKTHTKRKRLKKSEIDDVTSHVLHKYGMDNSHTRSMLSELIDYRKGTKVDSDKLVYKQMKKK